MTIYKCKICKQVKVQTEHIEDKANAICPDCKKKKKVNKNSEDYNPQSMVEGDEIPSNDTKTESPAETLNSKIKENGNR